MDGLNVRSLTCSREAKKEINFKLSLVKQSCEWTHKRTWSLIRFSFSFYSSTIMSGKNTRTQENRVHVKQETEQILFWFWAEHSTLPFVIQERGSQRFSPRRWTVRKSHPSFKKKVPFSSWSQCSLKDRGLKGRLCRLKKHSPYSFRFSLIHSTSVQEGTFLSSSFHSLPLSFPFF